MELTLYVLDQLFGLDIGQAVHTGDTITAYPIVSHNLPIDLLRIPRTAVGVARRRAVVLLKPWLAAVPSTTRPNQRNIPDRENAASLGEAGLLLNTANSLLEDGRNLGRRSLCFGIRADLYRGDVDGCGISGLARKTQGQQRPAKICCCALAARLPQELSQARTALPPRQPSSREGH